MVVMACGIVPILILTSYILKDTVIYSYIVSYSVRKLAAIGNEGVSLHHGGGTETVKGSDDVDKKKRKGCDRESKVTAEVSN